MKFKTLFGFNTTYDDDDDDDDDKSYQPLYC